MFIVKNRNIFYLLSVVLIAASLVLSVVWGLKFGIDFTGGSLLEISYSPPTTPSAAEVSGALEVAGITDASVRPTGETGYLIRTPFLSQDEYGAVKEALTSGGAWSYEEKRFDSVGPVIGNELQSKSIWAILLVLVVIALFIAFAFRKVSHPVSSWKYGFVALICLAHDVVVPVGAFAVLGHFLGAEVDTLFVTAILVVLGFSVHDTIVVFDRVRENLKKNTEKNIREPFEETVGHSVHQTFARSVNTSLTVVVTLLALYFFGPEVTRYFVLTLIIGIIAGTYSSI
ncbi:MAG: protein translocase subunit SecF, partial [Patescibacteria group bacterium]